MHVQVCAWVCVDVYACMLCVCASVQVHTCAHACAYLNWSAYNKLLISLAHCTNLHKLAAFQSRFYWLGNVAWLDQPVGNRSHKKTSEPCRRCCFLSKSFRLLVHREMGNGLLKRKKEMWRREMRSARKPPCKALCPSASSVADPGGGRGDARPRAGQKKKKRTRLRNWLPGVALRLAQFVSFWRQLCFTSEFSVRPFEITFLSLRNTHRYNEEEKAGRVFNFYCLRPFVEALSGRRNGSRTDRESGCWRLVLPPRPIEWVESRRVSV